MKQTESLELGVSQERALTTCRTAFADLGWEVVEANEGGLAAIEVPFRLECRRLPAEIEIRVRTLSPDRTRLTIEGTCTGIGSRRELGGYMAALQRRIRAQLSRSDGESPRRPSPRDVLLDSDAASDQAANGER